VVGAHLDQAQPVNLLGHFRRGFLSWTLPFRLLFAPIRFDCRAHYGLHYLLLLRPRGCFRVVLVRAMDVQSSSGQEMAHGRAGRGERRVWDGAAGCADEEGDACGEIGGEDGDWMDQTGARKRGHGCEEGIEGVEDADFPLSMCGWAGEDERMLCAGRGSGGGCSHLL
jgi:hypothetical protein